MDTLAEKMGESAFDLYRTKVEAFIKDTKSKYVKQRTSREIFKKQNETWFAKVIIDHNPSKQSKKKEYKEGNGRTVSRRSKAIREKYTLEELSEALEASYRQIGSKRAANIVRDLRRSRSAAGEKIRKKQRKSRARPLKPLSPQCAIAMKKEANLTKSQYNAVKRHLGKILPCYPLLLEKQKELSQEGALGENQSNEQQENQSTETDNEGSEEVEEVDGEITSEDEDNDEEEEDMETSDDEEEILAED